MHWLTCPFQIFSKDLLTTLIMAMRHEHIFMTDPRFLWRWPQSSLHSVDVLSFQSNLLPPLSRWMTPHNLFIHPDNRDSRFLWTTTEYIPHYTMTYPRKTVTYNIWFFSVCTAAPTATIRVQQNIYILLHGISFCTINYYYQHRSEADMPQSIPVLPSFLESS